jgi:hypothetical protein
MTITTAIIPLLLATIHVMVLNKLYYENHILIDHLESEFYKIKKIVTKEATTNVTIEKPEDGNRNDSKRKALEEITIEKKLPKIINNLDFGIQSQEICNYQVDKNIDENIIQQVPAPGFDYCPFPDEKKPVGIPDATIANFDHENLEFVSREVIRGLKFDFQKEDCLVDVVEEFDDQKSSPTQTETQKIESTKQKTRTRTTTTTTNTTPIPKKPKTNTTTMTNTTPIPKKSMTTTTTTTTATPIPKKAMRHQQTQYIHVARQQEKIGESLLSPKLLLQNINYSKKGSELYSTRIINKFAETEGYADLYQRKANYCGIEWLLDNNRPVFTTLSVAEMMVTNMFLDDNDKVHCLNVNNEKNTEEFFVYTCIKIGCKCRLAISPITITGYEQNTNVYCILQDKNYLPTMHVTGKELLPCFDKKIYSNERNTIRDTVMYLQKQLPVIIVKNEPKFPPSGEIIIVSKQGNDIGYIFRHEHCFELYNKTWKLCVEFNLYTNDNKCWKILQEKLQSTIHSEEAVIDDHECQPFFDQSIHTAFACYKCKNTACNLEYAVVELHKNLSSVPLFAYSR